MIDKKVNILLSGILESCQFPPLIPQKLPKKDWLKTFDDTLSLHIYTERYVNKGAYHSYRHFSEVAKKYRPLDGYRSFQFPYFLLPKNQANTYFSKSDSKIKKWLDRFSDTPFFVHSDMLETYKKSCSKQLLKSKIAGWVTAIPTASTRTVMVNLDGEIQMVKVDMSGKRLGRLTRQLPQKSVKRSQIIHDIIQKISVNKLPKTFAYFPEVLGITYNEVAGDLGNIYREY